MISKLLLDFDVNKTLIFQDTVKGVSNDEMFSAIISEGFEGDFGQDNKKITFENYVKTVLLPGDNSLKNQRRTFTYHIREWLQNNHHPLLKTIADCFDKLKQEFTDQGKIKPKVFDSFYALLDRLRELNIPFIIKLRTFGNDLPHVIEEIGKHPSGIKINRLGHFKEGKLHLGDKVIEDACEIFRTFLISNEHFGIKDDHAYWSKNNELQKAGKPFIYDSTGKAYAIRNLSLMLDDNYTQQDQDIICPIDIHGTDFHLEKHLIIKVNPFKAALDKNYFINLVEERLTAATGDKNRD